MPLLAWTLIAFRQQSAITARSHVDNGTNFAAIRFTRDVNSANAVALGGADCPPSISPLPASSAGGSTVLMSLAYDDNGNGESRTVYVVTATSDGGVLERHRCDSTGVLTDSDLVADQLGIPAGGWSTMAACVPRPGFPAADRGRCTLTLTSRDGRQTSVSAAIRTGGFR